MFNANANLTDQEMLTDQLMLEKFVADDYNTSVLESANPEVRKVFQHIQKEEQQHAEQIFQAMQKRGWYQVK